MKQLKISYIDLAVIIESIYYGGDEDVSDIEDLLKYLRDNGHLSTVLTVSRGLVMNKQEKDLIQALYDIGGCDAEDEWSKGYDDGVNASIEVIKELKVHGKVIFSHEEKLWLIGLMI